MNWKTTLFGTLASTAGSIATGATGKTQLIAQIIFGVSGALFAYFAKDKNVTGGTTPQLR